MSRKIRIRGMCKEIWVTHETHLQEMSPVAKLHIPHQLLPLLPADMSEWFLMYVGHTPESPKPKQCCLSLVSKHLHVDEEVLEIISSGNDDDDQCADEEQLGSYWAESMSAWKMKHFS